MEVFQGADFVRLRNRVRRSCYVAAEDDGLGVCLAEHRAAHNTVWAVQHFAGPPSAGVSGGVQAGHGPYVLLRGAYGRYLFATDRQATTGPSHGVTAIQHGNYSEQPTPPGFLWHAVPRRTSFVIRNATGRYLRANGKYLKWHTAVTVAGDSSSTMLQWAIEVVPLRVGRPTLVDQPVQLTRRRTPPTEGLVTRMIRYVRADPNGNFNEQAFKTIRVNNHSVMQLRLTLANRLGQNRSPLHNMGLCVRAGRYAQLSPLLIDLPIGTDRIDIVLLAHGTPAELALRYPDVDAE